MHIYIWKCVYIISIQLNGFHTLNKPEWPTTRHRHRIAERPETPPILPHGPHKFLFGFVLFCGHCRCAHSLSFFFCRGSARYSLRWRFPFLNGSLMQGWADSHAPSATLRTFCSLGVCPLVRLGGFWAPTQKDSLPGRKEFSHLDLRMI